MSDSHDPEAWAARPRSLDRYVVKECRDRGDSYEFSTVEHTGFVRLKADIGEPFAPGDVFELETVNFSLITGLRDASGRWRFRMTNEQLAEQSRQQSQDFHNRKVVELEKHKAEWWAIEEALPDWLRARINRFRDAAGEQFLLDGWGYELAICQLAEAYASGDQARVDVLDEQLGASGNQHDCARLLAELHRRGHSPQEIAQVPAGLAPITGSADYS
ncbi:hypothetical protein [Gordonia sp. UCD-TK1]|uniref:hypothetical protein n=1 Tax=Gordonia sp. UCD-TK1 TaxID=1857893 RepID=UPI00080E4EB6|nr:hypothetical protein [Gordonia sp. UCD-TK1]OCH80976.1 hypothetical protein A9310_19625 [Gordonia sp. UCD-TK1]